MRLPPFAGTFRLTNNAHTLASLPFDAWYARASEERFASAFPARFKSERSLLVFRLMLLVTKSHSTDEQIDNLRARRMLAVNTVSRGRAPPRHDTRSGSHAYLWPSSMAAMS